MVPLHTLPYRLLSVLCPLQDSRVHERDLGVSEPTILRDDGRP